MALNRLPPASWSNTWLNPLFVFLRYLLTWITGGSQWTYVDLVSTYPLAANTYANGTSGVGATLTGNSNGALAAIDGVVPAFGQVLLLVNESLGANNGAYVVTVAGTASAAYVLTRLSGFDASASMLVNTQFYVKSGTVHGGKVWEFLGAPLPTVGTTVLPFAGTVKRLLSRGVIPSSRIAFTANPANNDVFAIGGVTFKYVTTLAAATTFVQIKTLGSAALSLAATLDAINGVTNANVVDASTPFAGAVFADAPTATSLRIQSAAARGSKPIPTVSGSVALTVSITSGATTWTSTNLSVTGKRDSDQSQADSGPITVSAGVIASVTLYVEFPFTPTGFTAQAFSSAGVQRSYSDATVISGNAVVITLGGGASPNLQANDVLNVRAYQ